MRRYVLLAGVLATAGGCEKTKQKPFDGPMPVAFGDCAGPKTAWLSGPKPAWFSPDEAKDVEVLPPRVADNTPSAPPPEDPPPPEEGDKPEDGSDESGGTGTAMALEEGKMGKKGTPEDEAAARKAAIEQARNGGVLGSTALVQGGAFASLTGTGDISSGFDDSDIYGGLLGNEAGEMQGGYGYGRAGFGPGGGGTGWGTIGTGRYGKIGHGSGTGYGVGGNRRSSVAPMVRIGQPNAQGDLDKAIIRRYIKRNLQKITYCYEKELLAKPGLAGTVQAQFFITPNGEVASSKATGVDKTVSGCIADVIKVIAFPKPKGGGGVQVNYPFILDPGASTVKKAAPGTGTGSADVAAGSADVAAGSAAGSATAPAVGAGSAAAPKPRPMPPDDYRTGADNPLRSEQGALELCFRKERKKHHGVAVFDLAYDDKGAVAKADVHGIDDPAVKKCVLAVTKKVTSKGVKAERCSVAYGEMPVAVAPSIEVKADAITLNGTKLTTPDAESKDDSLQFKIPALYDALDARMRAARGTVVSIHGPLVIKAIDQAKMKVVNKVLNTTRAAGDDYVLAYQAGADWKLLSLTPVEFPVVPVPFGTGDLFSSPISRPRDTSLVVDDSEIVRLSVLVQPDKIWVGLSRVNEFQELPRDPAKLQAALTDHKTSAFFTDRTDIEIAGEGDAAYIDVINAIKAAEAAGFTKWQVGDPLGLSARPTL